MADFLELIESIAAEDASVTRLFGGGGDVPAARGPGTPEYKQRLLAAANFTAEVLEGKRPLRHLREAMSTSDFPLLFGATLDRMVLAEYRAAPSDWRTFLRVSSVRDFRTVDRYKMRDAHQTLDRVPEGANYPAGTLAEAGYSFRVNKYGRRYPLLWEALINDDLDAFSALPQMMARQARRTEDYFASSLYVANTTLYNVGNLNAGTKKLTAANLQTAFAAMAGFRDESGNPIYNSPVYLVVDPQLALEAQAIVQPLLGAAVAANASELVMRGRLQVLVDPYISVIDTTNGKTSWYLFADPRDGHAAEVAFLRGYEEPQIFVKSSNAVRLGAGPSDPLDGDYDTDAVDYKVRHVIGGSHANAAGGFRYTYWSNGTVA